MVDSRSVDSIQFKEAELLVVDDTKSARQLIEGLLADYQLDLTMARNGRQAVELVEKRDFELILMDIKMPVMDGYQATAQIKEKDDSIPIFAVTASVTEAERQEIESEQFAEFISKPLTKADLIENLADYLESSSKSTSVDKEAKSETESKTQEVSATIKAELEEHFLARAQELEEMFIIDRAEEFVTDLKEFGQEQEVQAVVDYASDLESLVEQFAVEEIKKKLASFSEFID